MTEQPQDGVGERPEPPQVDVPPPVLPAAYVPPHALGAPPQPVPPPGPVAPPPMPASPQTPPYPQTPAGSPIPVGPPAAPVAAVAPADWWRAVAVALLNLSGLGLGFVLLRRWRAAVACWIATALLLLIALPATPGGVPVGVVVIYLAFLVFAAVRGAVQALRTPLAWPPSSQIAAAMAAVLLVVPVGGTVLFDNARQEAVQRMLLSRLAQADAAIASAEAETADIAEPAEVTALGTYQDLLDHHRTSRAAKLVPARLTAFYQQVSTPYTQHDYCNAIEPLTFLRSLPTTAISAADLGSLVSFPNDPLATSLYQCGVSALGAKADPTAAQELNKLLATFPASDQAAKVEPAVAGAIGAAAGGITGADPCGATATLTGLGTQISELTSPVATVADGMKRDAGIARSDEEAGSFNCAVSDYKSGNFTDAQTAMDTFASTYPADPDKALAQKFSIAAQIAQEDADAGKVVPTLTSGGSVSITISNDSPDPIQILYTGPATGTVNVGACASCKLYASDQDGQQNACGDSGVDYPKTTFTLPPGTTYFLQKSTGTDVTPYTHSEQYDADSVYQVCAYETSIFGL